MRIPAAVLALVVAGPVGGCGPSAPTAVTPGQTAPQRTTPQPVARQTEVRLTCATEDDKAPCAFRPADVTVAVGRAVRWVNDVATYHTVTSTQSARVRRPSGRFHGVLDSAGEAFTVTFTQPGTYPYYCQPHAEFMAGVVHVVPA